jgi:hypothetical protein
LSGAPLPEQPPSCWLCRRPLGSRVQLHHPVPKAKRGRKTVPVHPICHKAIHANFTNAELARIGAEREALLAREQVAKFIDWVQDKHPDFHALTRAPR